MLSFENLYNAHKGETALVIGNGPSLKNVTSHRLEKFPSFGANRIYLKDDFAPTYYVCINPLVLQQNESDIKAIAAQARFVREKMGFDDSYQLHSMRAPMFSYAPFRYIYEGYTVTFVSLQLAFFMGFTTVLLVGVDHRYIYDGDPNEKQMMNGDDPNHFSPEYFKGQVWNNPDLRQSEISYGFALRAYEDDGRRIINLTPKSALHIFDKEKMEKWM